MFLSYVDIKVKSFLFEWTFQIIGESMLRPTVPPLVSPTDGSAVRSRALQVSYLLQQKGIRPRFKKSRNFPAGKIYFKVAFIDLKTIGIEFNLRVKFIFKLQYHLGFFNFFKFFTFFCLC